MLLVSERQGFYPRPRTGGDHMCSMVDWFRHSFYPRPRTGGDRP